MTKVFIEAEATKTAAYTSSTGLDISAATFAPARHIVIRIKNLQPTSGSGPKKATFAIQYVTAADFTTPIYGPTFNISGTFDPTRDRILSVPLRDFPSCPLGIATGKVRVALTALDSNSTITYSAHIE